MKLCEIVDFKIQQRNVKLMKQNAKRQREQAKAAQARLNMQKAQRKFNLATQAASNTPKP